MSYLDEVPPQFYKILGEEDIIDIIIPNWGKI